MNNDRFDFALVDPARNPARWDGVIHAVAARAVTAHRERNAFAYALLGWARPTVGIASAVALVAWLGAGTRNTNNTTSVTSNVPPSLVVASWAVSDERPSTATILEVLGNSDGTN